MYSYTIPESFKPIFILTNCIGHFAHCWIIYYNNKYFYLASIEYTYIELHRLYVKNFTITQTVSLILLSSPHIQPGSYV